MQTGRIGYGHVDMSLSRRVSKQPEHESVAFAPSLVAQSMRHNAPRLTSVEKGLWPLLVYNVFVRCAVRCAPQITEKSGIYIVQVEL